MVPTDPFPGAFEEFLSDFKESASTSEAAAAEALGGLNLDENEDDYDFMEDAPEQNEQRTRNTQKTSPRKKYMEILQNIADRKSQEICIELDDLATVRMRLLLVTETI